jgi:hypothetical protein
MKKYLLIQLVVLGFVCTTIAQTYHATLTIGNVDVSGSEPGAEFTIPVKLSNRSGGLIKGLQLYIEFDHALFEWAGTYEFPLNGIKDLHARMPYNSEDWMFNDTGLQFVALWMDPSFNGIGMGDDELIFNLVFVYKTKMPVGSEARFVWGETIEIVDGLLIRGETKMVSEKMDYFNLTLVNGSVKCD